MASQTGRDTVTNSQFVILKQGSAVLSSGNPLPVNIGNASVSIPADVTLAGLYGLQTRIGGARADHPEGDAWRQVVADVVGTVVTM